MYRAGVFALIVGAAATVLGLVAGFGFLFADQDAPAKLLLAAVPVGFLLVFAGIVITLFGSPDVND